MSATGGWSGYALDREGTTKGPRFYLRAGLNRVGSRSGAELVLGEPGVSQRHAALVVAGGEIAVEDLASKNGTFLNGRRIRQGSLGLGDVVHFGPVGLRLVRVEPDDGRVALAFDLRSAGGPADRDRETATAGPGEPAVPDLPFPEGHVPGRSAAAAELYREIADCARSHAPVLLLGETGSGKDEVARLIHRISARARQPFVAVNCAAIPATLLEADLFGIGPGVATGVTERPGRFRLAHGGTLLLDEVGDLPLELQAKLLRALEGGEIQPLGQAPTAADVRVVAATNAELAGRVRDGRFRADLYYRLAGLLVRVPPLRERREDLPVLAAHFGARAAAEAGKTLPGLTAAALHRLAAHPWPGNVRELAHVLERLVARCPEGQPIDARRVDDALAADRGETVPESAHRAASPPADGSGLDLAALERRALQEALRAAGGRRDRAALLLGISRDTLRRRLARHRLAG